MKNRIMVMIMAAVFALPAMAGWINQDQKDATVQQSAFQSTSTMTPSGSAYSATPAALNDDGTASYDGASAPASAPGKRKLGPDPSSDIKPEDQVPVGDAVLPLMLMAAAAAGVVALRRRRTLAKA